MSTVAVPSDATSAGGRHPPARGCSRRSPSSASASLGVPGRADGGQAGAARPSLRQSSGSEHQSWPFFSGRFAGRPCCRPRPSAGWRSSRACGDQSMAAALFSPPQRFRCAITEPDRAVVQPSHGLALGVLAVSIGPPFAVLSATAPLVQAWHSRAAPRTEEGKSEPHVLYAASNPRQPPCAERSLSRRSWSRV